MNEASDSTALPARIAAIKRTGYVKFTGTGLSADFMRRFDSERIPVTGVRHVRVWGIQVDDERVLPGRERTSIPDEEIWEIKLQASNGSSYEVDSTLVVPVED